MKILQINNYPYRRGGAEVVYFNITKLLRSKGHDVITFSRKIDGFDNEKIDYLISEQKFFFNRFYSLQAKEYISLILQREKPDIVHIHNIVGGISFSILPEIKKFNVPIIASIHDFRLLCPVGVMINGNGEICEKCKTGRYYQGIKNKCHPDGIFKSSTVVFESYLRDIFIHHKNYFDAYLFVSNFTREKFLEFYPEINNKSFVLYNFNQAFDEEIIRGNYFLYFGRYDREKGLITLLKAFQQLKDIKLILAGRGPIEKNINDYNSNGNIFNVGFKQGNELIKLIKQSEFIIIPSECYETLSMSAVETFSLSKPIIASRLGGLHELVIKSNAGFEFQHKNLDDLIRVIKQAKSISNSEHSLLSSNAYKFAVKEFSPENYYEKLISIYENLVNSK